MTLTILVLLTVRAQHTGALWRNECASVQLAEMPKLSDVRLLNETGGVVAATSYAILSVTPYTFGLSAHATHFVVLPVLAGVLLLLRPSGLASLPSAPAR